MPQFTVLRKNDVPVTFDGEQLADVDNDDGYADYWQHTRIYRTDKNKYVVEIIGETRLPGKVTRRHVVICDASEVREALSRRNDEGRLYITDTSLDALLDAAEVDPALAALSAERI